MPTCGVYRLYHAGTNQEYIGSSIKIEKRIDHHLFCLRANRHTSGLLQILWNKTSPDEWAFEILVECAPEERINREQYYIDHSEGLLNHLIVAGSTRKRVVSEETKIKLRAARAKYLETPGAREALAARARKQHAAGKLGARTWTNGPDYSAPQMVEARRKGTEAMAQAATEVGSAEMRRRSMLRKNIRKTDHV